MKLSKYQQAVRLEQKKKAFRMHKAGATTREIGKMLGKSPQWASDAIKLLSTLKQS